MGKLVTGADSTCRKYVVKYIGRMARIIFRDQNRIVYAIC